MGKFIDITGHCYGRWTVLGFTRKNRTGMSYWRCRCECGTTKDVLAAQLRSGGSQSCGCLQRLGIIAPKSTRHGMSRHPTYRVWAEMLSRCRNPKNAGYVWYGGRGIKVCDRWADFALFWQDMGPAWRRGLSLERRLNNEGYGPKNCYWATDHQQTRNTRRNRYIETEWGRMIIADAAQKAGIDSRIIYGRMRAGWPEDRLTEPVMGRWERRKCQELR